MDGGFAKRTLTVFQSAFVQATVSAVCSALLAIPAAVALARQRHQRFYQPLRLLCGVAFIVPTTVAATGLLSIWGRKGLVAEVCRLIFTSNVCDQMTVFGLHGVVLAHMFLNVPLMILVFLAMIEQIPISYYALAHHLGMSRHHRFRMIEWPAVKVALPGVIVLVFLLCFSSFSMVLMLGGGPAVTTLEVEIYAAIRFDFDFAAAAGLSLIQFAFAGLVVSLIALFGGFTPGLKTSDSITAHHSTAGWMKFRDAGWHDALALTVFFVIVILPLIMVFVDGINPALMKVVTSINFWTVLKNSVAIALTSACVTVVFGLILAVARARVQDGAMVKMLIDSGVMLYLVLPAVVLGTAAFIILRDLGDAFAYAFWVVVLANALLALPFAVRMLENRLKLIFNQHDHLAVALGVEGMTRWRLLTLPLLLKELGTVLGLAAAISIGDLGVIALFATDDLQTLPWLLYQTSGRYQADAAKALAMLLLILAVILLVSGRYLPQLLIGRLRHAAR